MNFSRVRQPQGEWLYGLAAVDISTGAFTVTEVRETALLAEIAELPEDLYVFNIDYHDNNTISAGIYSKNINKDSRKGIFVGSYTNGIIQGFYNLESEQNKKDHEFFLKGDKKGFVLGTGKTTTVKGVEKFQRPLNIKWDEKIKYIPAEDCTALLRG